MPQALPVDREKVKMVALQIGVREAARQFELPESTVKSWSTREGWFAQQQEIQQITERYVEERGLRPTASKTPSEVLLRLGNKSKLKAAKLGDKTLTVLQRKAQDTDGESLITLAPVLKTTVDTLDKVHQWSGNTQSLTQVNINLSQGKLPDRSK